MDQESGTIRAIETVYKGYRFRSRLEARWAVFFDALGIPYEYEPQGFSLNGMSYLPDFYLPTLRWWVEVKPDRPTGIDAEKCARFGEALAAQRRAIWEGQGEFAAPDDDDPGIQYYAVFVGSPGQVVVLECYGRNLSNDAELAECALCHRLISTNIQRGASYESDGLAWDMYHCEWCDTRDRLSHGDKAPRAYFHKGDVVVGYDVCCSPRLTVAYHAARGARFEHGERGAPR